IEFCDNLAQGGTTPSYAVNEETVNYANKHNATVMTMVRSRAENFVYSAMDHEMMKRVLYFIKELNSNGNLLGSLTPENSIDRTKTTELINLSAVMEITFHMAFDEIPKDRQKSELDWLIENKVTRILTHGGLEGTVFDNLSWLKELVEHAAGRIEILVGGGVTYENWPQLAESLSTDQFHGTKIVPLESIQ